VICINLHIKITCGDGLREKLPAVRVQAQNRSEVMLGCTDGDELAVSVCLDRREGMSADFSAALHTLLHRLHKICSMYIIYNMS